MMATVISVPSMGAARILLIPGVIQAPQQRNRRHTDKAGQSGAVWCLRAHGGRAATAATFCGNHIWCSTEGRTEHFVCLYMTSFNNVQHLCSTFQVLSQQCDSSVFFFILGVIVEQCSGLHSYNVGCGFDSQLDPFCTESAHSPCCSDVTSYCQTSVKAWAKLQPRGHMHPVILYNPIHHT